jgi:hypothetical protein
MIVQVRRTRTRTGGDLVTCDEEHVAATVRDREDQRYRAAVAGDVELFARLAHPDLAYTHSDGTLDDLDSYVRKCREGYYVYDSIEHPIDRITVVGTRPSSSAR